MPRARRTIQRTAKNSNPTITQAFDDFIQEKRIQNKSQSTIEGYSVSMKVFCRELDIDPDTELVKDLCKEDVLDFIEALQDKDLAIASINHHLTSIKAFVLWCADDEREYLKPFKIQKLAGQDVGIKFFTDDEVEKLIAKPDGKDGFVEWRTWCIVCFILGTGARIGSVVDVSLEDVDFDAKLIHFTHTKNKRALSVPLTEATSRYLKQYIREWRGFAEQQDYLFPNESEEALTTNAAKQAFYDYCSRRGVAKTSLHGLRHTFARNYIINGGNPASLQTILGHRTPAMTMHYVQLFGTDLQEGAEQVTMLDVITKNQSRTKRVRRRGE